MLKWTNKTTSTVWQKKQKKKETGHSYMTPPGSKYGMPERPGKDKEGSSIIVRGTYFGRHNGSCDDRRLLRRPASRLLGEVLALRLLLDSDNAYCLVVAFIGCELLLGCNAVLLGVYYGA